LPSTSYLLPYRVESIQLCKVFPFSRAALHARCLSRSLCDTRQSPRDTLKNTCCGFKTTTHEPPRGVFALVPRSACLCPCPCVCVCARACCIVCGVVHPHGRVSCNHCHGRVTLGAVQFGNHRNGMETPMPLLVQKLT